MKKLEVLFSVPWRSIWAFLGLVVLCGFGYVQFQYWIIPNIGGLFSKKPPVLGIQDLWLVWPPIIGYVLIGVGMCLAVLIFKPLKPYSKRGLVWGLLVGGLVWGLMVGLMWGLGTGFLVGHVGFITGLISTLALGLIVGLVAGLVLGLMVGLFNEFKT